MTDEANDEATKTRKKFDSNSLRERLAGRALREGQITLYLDEITGDELGYARDKKAGAFVLERERSGVLGELDALEEGDPKRAELEKRRDELLAKLNEDTLVIKLKAVPQVVSESYERKAKDKLGIKGKPTEDDEENLASVMAALRLVDIVTSMTDSDGNTYEFDYDAAKALPEHLPLSQYRRLAQKVSEVQGKDAFDEIVTADSDF